MAKTKVEVPREFEPLDILKVNNKKPGFSYRWVKKANLEMKRMHGWTPVIRTDEEIQRSSDFGLGAGKVIERGDLVLCLMPTALCNQLKAAKAMKAKRQMDAIKRGGRMKFAGKGGQQKGTDSLETLHELGVGSQREVLHEQTVTEPAAKADE